VTPAQQNLAEARASLAKVQAVIERRDQAVYQCPACKSRAFGAVNGESWCYCRPVAVRMVLVKEGR
jgi:hypothetical protein